MGRSRRLDHLTFGLDQHCSFLVAGLAVAAAVVDVELADEEEEAQLDLACASGLVDGLVERKTAASVEWPAADTKQRLVDASATCFAFADSVAASYAFDSSEDCTVAVLCVVDGAAMMAFAGDVAGWTIADGVVIADVEKLDDAFVAAAVLKAAGVGAVDHADVADDGLVLFAVGERGVVLVIDAAAANAAFVQ